MKNKFKKVIAYVVSPILFTIGHISHLLYSNCMAASGMIEEWADTEVMWEDVSEDEK